MALIKCHECGKEVSTEAVACPGCGAKPKKPTSAVVKYGGGFLAVMFALAFFSGGSKSVAPSGNTPAEPIPAAKKECAIDDLQCQGDEAVVAAAIYCKRPVEAMATHSVRWTDGTFESKFNRFRWKDKDANIITMVGDRAEFQNGFGAYTPVIYECDLAADRKTVLDVRVREGRLP